MELPENLFIESLKSLGFDKDDYFAIAEKFNPVVLRVYLEMAYVIGYETASRNLQNRSNRKIIPINEFGIESKPFDSIVDAAKTLNINYDNLRKVIGKQKKCGGYFWKYA